MSIWQSKLEYALISSTAVWIAAIVCASTVCAQPLIFEDFEDQTLATNVQVNLGTIDGGFASFVDDSGTTRARVTAVQDFTSEIMTFSWDMKAPVVETTGGMELLIRAGIGTTHQTLQNADWIFEVIAYRNDPVDPTRFDFANNGNESLFVVVNNKASDLSFTSPIDASSVTIPGFNYIAYVKNNETDAFGTLKPVSAFMDRNGAEAGFGTMSRFGIGTSSNGHQGTFALDNVRVVPEVSFSTIVTPPPKLGDTDGDMDVDLDDFEPIRANFRNSVTLRSQGDLVRNNRVDFDDFRQWKTAFLAGGGSLVGVDLGFGENVPEPSTGLLLLLAIGMLTGRRRAT